MTIARTAAMPQILRFALVGVLNTAIDFLLFALLFYLGHWPLLLANATGFIAAVANSYLLNRSWTFRAETPPNLADGMRFLIVATCGLALGSLAIFAAAFVMPAFAAKACAIAVTFAWNYWASGRFVFARSPARRTRMAGSGACASHRISRARRRRSGSAGCAGP